MRSLIVTAVGSFFRRSNWTAKFPPVTSNPSNKSSGSATPSESGSGWMTVPPPLGFSTFVMRMGILRRMTYKPHECLAKRKSLLVTYLVHSEWVDDLAPIVRQFGGLFRGDDGD